MCGFAGFWGTAVAGDAAREVVRRMTDAIAHRGPDDEGRWSEPEEGLVLGHRRLSILDLSAAGHQPMHSASGRFVLVYNGEIYNFRDLRAQLEAAGAAPTWRGHSDTEILLAGFDHWGLEETLARAHGMFALALWDRRHRTLTLARDRLGEKPLYYGQMGQSLLFGSELKSLLAHPEFVREVDRSALTGLMRFNYVPAPATIWRGIFKLPPAHYVVVRDGGRVIDEPRAFWSLADVAMRGAADPLPDGPELIDQLDALLRDAVLRQMEADVPLGAFLSGGIDSSLIVALMQAQSTRPIKTFTIGFAERSHDEAVHARAVAGHLGTDHHEWYVTPADALAVVPRLPAMYDEPFADSSQIPTHLVSALARRSVTVSLSGDAGDELFGGYTRYTLGLKMLELGRRLGPLRGVVAGAMRSRLTIGATEFAMGLLPASKRHMGIRDRLPKVGHALQAPDAEALYRRLVSWNNDPAALVRGGDDRRVDLVDPGLLDVRQSMMYRDAMTYLPDDILAKVDRAGMAVSLESRIPFLDPRVVEFAWRLPMSAKIRDGKGKHILREMLWRYVPRELIERPKAGFGVPIADWLTGPLRDWAEAQLDPRRLRDEGYFNPKAVRELWDAQLSGGSVQHNLWAVLMAQAWIAEYAAPAASQPSAPQPAFA